MQSSSRFAPELALYKKVATAEFELRPDGARFEPTRVEAPLLCTPIRKLRGEVGQRQSPACAYAATDPFEPPLVLDAAQQAFMIDACYPYSVIEHFRDTDGALLDQVPAPEQYGLFRRMLEVASGYGIDGGATAILFCTLALTRGPDFYAQPPWRTELERVKRVETTLQQAVKAKHD